MSHKVLSTLQVQSAVVLLLIHAVLSAPANAQGKPGENFPVKPLRMIVPFAAGGGTDVIARLLAPRMHEALGVQVVVDNRAGGGSVIGSEIVARSPADGHTLLFTANPHTTNPSLHSKLPYDTVRDFAAVTMIAQAPLMMVAHASVPARNVKDLIALARARPGQLVYGTSGNGGPQHFAGELFKHMTGVNIVHVPYKGGGPATIDLLGGNISLMFNAMLNAVPHVASGRLHALAVTSRQRSSVAPQVPTLEESGLKEFEVLTWYGLFTVGGTPDAVIRQLATAAVGAVNHPTVTDHLRRGGVSPAGSSPEAFGRFVIEEIERLRKIARQSGMRIE